MNKPSIIIKTTTYKPLEILDTQRKIYLHQLANDGLIVLPYEYEYTVINANDLEAKIIVKDIYSDQPKKKNLIDKFIGILKGADNDTSTKES